MKAENVFDMTRPLSVADGQLFSKEDYAAEAAILEMPQSPAAIRRSAFLELILRQIPDGVIVCDGRGTIVLANPAAKATRAAGSRRAVTGFRPKHLGRTVRCQWSSHCSGRLASHESPARAIHER